jgi:hypothetical protein
VVRGGLCRRDSASQRRRVNLLTVAAPHLCYPVGVMKGSFNILTIVQAVCVAAYVAITLGHVALYNFGLSGEDVRGAAMIIAVPTAAMVAIDFFSKKLRKAK